MSLAILSDALKAPLVGTDAVFTDVGIDTRTLKSGDLFVAIKGPHFDGHHFLAEAIRAGAAGAVLSETVDTSLPHLRVEDTRLALGRFAAFWRQQFDIPVIAVTGSNGKTTVKEMIAAILGKIGTVQATCGNLNNDIGLPLTLLGLRNQHRYAVIEMGMNRPGEIDYLSRLAHPSIAVITNAAEAHLEGLGTVEAVARAKGEIFAGLDEAGVAVINVDDPYCDLWRQLAAPHRCLTFGLENKADVRAEYAQDSGGSVIHLLTTQGDLDMRLPLLGKHNVMNALAASTAALGSGASLQVIQAGLEKLQAVSGRLELKEGISGARVIDDTYNANPSSLAAGLQVLKDFGGERVLVLGDMAELGEAAVEIHRRVGELAQRIGLHRLYAVGTLSKHAVKAFGKGGRHFDSPEALIDVLRDYLHAEMTVLVKGSRAMRMERVVDGITRQSEPADTDSKRRLT
jgi:UDP-N-acetylmuramoyl-tripeptide--D-alanyl-D-alanine ligase